MSSKGLIYLYDSETNTPIDVKKYPDRQKRRRIIEGWKKKYSHGFYRCHIIISPEIYEDWDFDFIERELDKSIKPVKPTKFVRPKAEYKSIYNTGSLYNYD